MKERSVRWLRRGLAATALGAVVAGALPTAAVPWSDRFSFASDRFREVWAETDANPGNRSLVWGPRPWFDYREFYRQSPNGLRQVQYFDKARMEINNPAVAGRAGVTNGLLSVEMISGRIKLGDEPTMEANEQRQPAGIPVAGDLLKVNPDAPTYASFARIATADNNYTDRNRLNERIGTTFDKAGNIGFRQDLANFAGTNIVRYATVTGHNEPQVFVDYQNTLPNALSTFGYPITDPYWIRAKVGGVDKDIMTQIYERRVLTYTPSNPDPFKVEMGNVGQHYFQWRYPEMGAPWEGKEPYIPVAFGSNRATPGHMETFTTDASGAGVGQITGGGQDTIPFSMRRSWDQSQVYIVGSSSRDAGKLQLYALSLDGSVQRRLHRSEANDFNGSVSPDGTKIAFASDRDGNPELFLLNITGGAVAQLTTTANCANEYPTWFPDGSGLVYSSNCTGNYEVFRAELRYTQDKGNDLKVTLVNPGNLSENPAADRYPRVNPGGNLVAFQSNRDGNGELYVMRSRLPAGGALQRLTNSSGGDESSPTWSPDGSQIVYESNVEGDFELYIRSVDPSQRARQLTENARDDRFPIFAQ